MSNLTVTRNNQSYKLTKKNSCAPGKGNNTTCFDKSSLNKIASMWNKKNPSEKINITNHNENLWKQINDKMRKKCNFTS